MTDSGWHCYDCKTLYPPHYQRNIVIPHAKFSNKIICYFCFSYYLIESCRNKCIRNCLDAIKTQTSYFIYIAQCNRAMFVFSQYKLAIEGDNFYLNNIFERNQSLSFSNTPCQLVCIVAEMPLKKRGKFR